MEEVLYIACVPFRCDHMSFYSLLGNRDLPYKNYIEIKLVLKAGTIHAIKR